MELSLVIMRPNLTFNECRREMCIARKKAGNISPSSFIPADDLTTLEDFGDVTLSLSFSPSFTAVRIN